MTRRMESGEGSVTPWLVIIAAAVGVFAWFAGPKGDHLGRQLSDFFGASAQVLAGLLVALALFQSTSILAGRSARRFLSIAVFPLLGAGLIASLVGLVDSLAEEVYRLLFAATVGSGTAALVSVLLVGAANIRGQALDEAQATLAAIHAKAHELDPDRPPGSGG